MLKIEFWKIHFCALRSYGCKERAVGGLISSVAVRADDPDYFNTADGQMCHSIYI